jgi:TIR domain
VPEARNTSGGALPDARLWCRETSWTARTDLHRSRVDPIGLRRPSVLRSRRVRATVELVPAAEVFVSYAHEDANHLGSLSAQLSLLRRQGLVDLWHDGQILPGTDWRQDISKHLTQANMILLLVSADFLNSDYCWSVELDHALHRSDAIVVPLIVRPCLWQEAPFAHLQALPTEGRPITTWPNAEEAWLDVASGLATLIHALPSGPRV